MLHILHSGSLKGKREENQDSILIKEFQDGSILMAVADGIGSSDIGKEVAEVAIRTVANHFKRDKISNPLERIKDTILVANSRVKGMGTSINDGTTLSIVYYQNGVIYFGNVGDSRVWLCRDGKSINLTIDQNLYELYKINRMEPLEGDKTVLLYALGCNSNISLETLFNSKIWSATGEMELKGGDILIISSDGFHDYLNSSNFCSGLNKLNNFNKLLKEIEVKSNDNISYIIAKETK